MIARLGLLFAILCAAVAPALAADTCGPKRVAFTFDDAPRPGSAVMSGPERTVRLIAALDRAGVDGAAFFATTMHADAVGLERLRAYAAAGHLIANHSHSHPNLHASETADYLADIDRADAILSELPAYRRVFRFPMLNEGQSVEVRDAVRAALRERGFTQGYITIDNFDFYIDNLLRRATEAGRTVDREALGRLYVDTIMGAARHYDALACRWLGRSPAHVLLLHENDLAALYAVNLAAAFRDEGWEIIAASEAYRDPIAASAPDTLALGQGRVAALAHLAGAPEEALRHQGENTDYLETRFAREVLGERE